MSGPTNPSYNSRQWGLWISISDEAIAAFSGCFTDVRERFTCPMREIIYMAGTTDQQVGGSSYQTPSIQSLRVRPSLHVPSAPVYTASVLLQACFCLDMGVFLALFGGGFVGCFACSGNAVPVSDELNHLIYRSGLCGYSLVVYLVLLLKAPGLSFRRREIPCSDFHSSI